MMLTENEREWLNNRDNHAEHFCRWCDAWEDCQGELNALLCPSWTQKVQLREAAEFEAKVAAKLATEHENIMLNGGVCEACFAWETCFNGFEENDNALCSFEMLKAARLQVEEEMDNDNR